nr:5-histidylcysteine sulfoxide synthase [Bacteroidales bacterium]
MTHIVSHTVDLANGNSEEKKTEIRDYFLTTFALDEKIYETLKTDEAFFKRADPLRHPLIFYYGHTAAFYINKLILAKMIDARINPLFESLFAIGVDEMSWDDLNEQHYNWPSVSEVYDYRQKVKTLVLSVIENTPLTMPITAENPFWLIMMGIEHERIHVETSSVLIRQLPLEDIRINVLGTPCSDTGKSADNRLLPVAGVHLILGKPDNHRFYGWDLEYGKSRNQVKPFEASEYLISNGEFLDFVKDAAYHKKEYWTDEGWNWKQFQKAAFPLFWRKAHNKYFLRLVDQEIELPLNWPAEVNYLEAKAFANWKTKKEGKRFRLPTEEEWYSMAQQNGINDENFTSISANIALSHFSSPCPVDQFKQGNFYDLVGNVWQWTETPLTGFPGFKVHPLYDDFSAPTFDGLHHIIKGGSWISSGNEATWHARYAFRRHFYQHAGFRLVQSENALQISNDAYEKDPEVAQSCAFNYEEAPLALAHFHKQIAEICIKQIDGRTGLKMLDLNCDTGRTVFELAEHFDHITGIDFSTRFIRRAIQLQEKGFIRYITKDEGDLLHYIEVQLTVLGLTITDNLQFIQADANNLKTIYCGYDMILAIHLLEELHAPDRFLASIGERLNE